MLTFDEMSKLLGVSKTYLFKLRIELDLETRPRGPKP